MRVRVIESFNTGACLIRCARACPSSSRYVRSITDSNSSWCWDAQGHDGRPFVRKEGASFGWNWGPCYAATGVWRPLRLVWTEAAVLAEMAVFVSPAPASDAAASSTDARTAAGAAGTAGAAGAAGAGVRPAFVTASPPQAFNVRVNTTLCVAAAGSYVVTARGVWSDSATSAVVVHATGPGCGVSINPVCGTAWGGATRGRGKGRWLMGLRKRASFSRFPSPACTERRVLPAARNESEPFCQAG